VKSHFGVERRLSIFELKMSNFQNMTTMDFHVLTEKLTSLEIEMQTFVGPRHVKKQIPSPMII
jgi:hypothetical protein